MFTKITDGLARNEDGAEVSWTVDEVFYREGGKELGVYAELAGTEKGGTSLTVVFGPLRWKQPFENEEISGPNSERIKRNIREGLHVLFDEKDELEFAN